MDNFPVRRGIGLSRTPHAAPVISFPHRPVEQLQAKMFPPQVTVGNRMPQQPVDLYLNKNFPSHSRTFSMGVPTATQLEKIITPEIALREQILKQGSVPIQSPHTQNRTIPIPNGQPVQAMPQGEPIQATEQGRIGIQQMAVEDAWRSISLVEPGSSITQAQPNSPTKLLPSPFKAHPIVLQQIQEITVAPNSNDIKISPVEHTESPGITWKKEKEQLQQELKNMVQQQQNWKSEKESLIKIIEEKQSQIASLKQAQERGRKSEQQLYVKVTAMESQLRLMKGNKNRLELEIDSSKKLFKSEREKNEKARDQINKLIFFEDDLIHAKDYNRLKDELEYILAENARLFNQHQQYIVEVGEARRTADARLREMEEELSKLRTEQGSFEQRLEAVGAVGEEKMAVLKLQSEVNFLRKKCEEQVEKLRSKDAQLEAALTEVQRLSDTHHEKRSESTSVLDQISIRQINDAVVLYEARVSDLSENLAKSQAESDRARKTVELLTSQLRKTREQRSIYALREKSSENSLKSEVEILQKGHVTELELRDKRIANLDDLVHRKAREIAEKDRFIKEFLIGRAKHLEAATLDALLSALKAYFNPGPPPQSESVGQPPQSGQSGQ